MARAVVDGPGEEGIVSNAVGSSDVGRYREMADDRFINRFSPYDMIQHHPEPSTSSEMQPSLSPCKWIRAIHLRMDRTSSTPLVRLLPDILAPTSQLVPPDYSTKWDAASAVFAYTAHLHGSDQLAIQLGRVVKRGQDM